MRSRDGPLRTFDDLVTAGKIRYAGLLEHPAWFTADSARSEVHVVSAHAGRCPVPVIPVHKVETFVF
jgi:aryl-alcohol dehydrogenase-like predicted oxidoreductase